MSTQSERTQIAVLQNDMQQVKSDISDIKVDIKTIKDSLDGKYAAKWVQQIVGAMVALILIAVVTALLALVIIPATKKNPDGTTPSSASSGTSSGNPSSSGPSGTPSANANAQATSDGTTNKDSQSSGGLVDTLKDQAGL